MPVLVAGGAADIAAVVQQHRSAGLATRRRRMPRFRWPTLVEVEYAKAIAHIVDVRDEIAPLLAELPQLLDRAARARGNLRQDEGEARRARDLLERGRRLLDRSMNTNELERLAGQMARRTSDHQRTELRRQVQAAIGVDLVTIDRRVPALIDDFVGENVTLIRSLGNKTLDDVNKIVARAFTRGERAEQVAGEIAERYEIAERHARLIARDQIGTLTGQITAARHEEIGLTKFRWGSMNDARVRPEHRALNGKVFSYDKLPSEGMPGEPIGCRCYQEPVIEDIDALMGAAPPAAPRRARRAPAALTPVAPPPTAAERAVHAVGDGDLPGARREVETDLNGRSLARRAWVADSSTTTVAPLPRGILGDHMPGSGNIRLTPSTARDAKAFAKAWRKDPAKARAAIAEFQTHRDDYLSGRRSDPPDPRSDGARLFRQSVRYETIVHETLHGYGPVPAQGFRSMRHVRIEEVTTESAARKIMREQFGASFRGAPGRGQDFSYGYEEWLHQTARGIAASSGVDFDRAWSAMLDASEDFKRTAALSVDSEQDFADFVHQRLGGRTTATAQQIKAAIRSSWTLPVR